ncbi:hypothetical protein AZE42_06293 [Rhizopogon vesiculosus]|uniref:Uncharacterized protein n=1 Tax=Rhizopogon vesiculosus TaxID=180088 RepID=A0A1J8QB39_9AGAM|nr:hypothetical protein AZE42_06293 [Rhizopogon vesiculosus]
MDVILAAEYPVGEELSNDLVAFNRIRVFGDETRKRVRRLRKARKLCSYEVRAVAVSGDSRWVITAGGDFDHGELKAWEIETEIVKTFHGHSRVTTDHLHRYLRGRHPACEWFR